MATAPLKTAAETALLARFPAEKSSLPGAAAARAAAFAAFAEKGLPHRRVEDWRWTDLRGKLVAVPSSAGAGDPARVAAVPSAFAGIETRRLVLCNGRLSPALSDLAGLEAGLVIESLADGLAKGDEASLGVSAEAAANAAVQLNTAFVSDGLSIRLAAGATLQRPLEIVHLSDGAAASSTIRVRVRLDDGAKATLLQSYGSTGAEAHHVNGLTRIELGAASELDLVTVEAEPEKAVSFVTLDAELQRGARLRSFHAALGAGLARSQLFARFEGEGAEAHFRGVTLVDGERHADTTLLVTHNAPACISRERFRAAVNDHGRSVFQGRIAVPAHAQGTDGRMSTAALLLSAEAEAFAKPELEIFADDVQCGHGATSGEIDDDQLFYLMARGIPRDEARAMLVLAFVTGIVDEIDDEPLRDLLVARFENVLGRKGTP